MVVLGTDIFKSTKNDHQVYVTPDRNVRHGFFCIFKAIKWMTLPAQVTRPLHLFNFAEYNWLEAEVLTKHLRFGWVEQALVQC